VIDILGKEVPKAEIPHIKLDKKFSLDTDEWLTSLTSLSPAVEKQSTPRMTADEPTMAVATRRT